MIKNKDEKKSILLIMLFSILICFFVCGMSPLYDFYYFLHDCSVYYVMGRGMKAGLVPYVDLFDHKGLYLYIVNMLGSLVSYRHIGMYIISIITTFLYGLFIYKILEIFSKKNIVNIISTLIMICIYWLSYVSNNVLNPEQYILTIEVIAIYLFLRLLQDDIVDKKKKKYLMIEGLLFSIVLFIKFNHILFFVGLGISYIICKTIKGKNAEILKDISYVIAGIVIGALPVLVYCIATNSLNEMIDAYFLLNIKYGSHGFAKYGDLSKAELFLRTMRKYVVLFIMLFISSVFSYKIFDKINKEELKVSYIVLLIVDLIIIIMPLTGLNYYTAIMIPFFIPTVGLIVDKIYVYNEKYNIFKTMVLIIVMAICTYIFSYKEMVTGKAIKDNKESIKMAKSISGKNKKDNSVLFVGYCTYVYNEVDILPGSKYFYIPIIRYEDKPELYDTIKEEVLTNKHNVVGIMYDQKFICDIFGDILVNHLNSKYKLEQSLGNKFIYKRKW